MKLSKTLAIGLVTAGAFACSDPSAPQGDNPVTIDLCGDIGPFGWFAYKNEGGEWTRITPNGDGQLAFDATDKVSVAMAFSFFGSSITQVLNATADELQAGASLPCDAGLSGDMSMNGTVTGISGEQFVRISAASEATSVVASNPVWELDFLPSQPVDIVATRQATVFTQPASRVLVRRGIIPLNGTISALDFNSIEAATVESAIATFTNIPTNGIVEVMSEVQTQNGTLHELGAMSMTNAGSSQGINYISLPASLRFTNDIHTLTGMASTADGMLQAVHFYKTPGAKTIAFGPMIGEPTVNNAASSPYVRPRVQLAAQAAYPSGIAAMFNEGDENSSRLVMVMTTRGFFGTTPTTWDVTVPDMSSAEYQSSWGLQTTTYNWNVAAYASTHPDGMLAATPVDGATITSAMRIKENVIFSRAAGAGMLLSRARKSALRKAPPR
jgi:hypothetical protein